jgi:hypothetical protein
MVATVRWMYNSGLQRQETRGRHKRMDYPKFSVNLFLLVQDRNRAGEDEGDGGDNSSLLVVMVGDRSDKCELNFCQSPLVFV